MFTPFDSSLDPTRRRLSLPPLGQSFDTPRDISPARDRCADPKVRSSRSTNDTFERASASPLLSDIASGKKLLRRGSTGDDVRQLQEELRKRGYQIDADGRYGRRTQRAVRRFQSRQGAQVDGIVGPETMGKLDKARPTKPTPGTDDQSKKGPGAVGPAGGPISLSGDDKKTASDIDAFLKKKGSPAAGVGPPTAGEMMVDAGKKYGVDPRVLLAIAGHETGYGKLGVGVRKMLGVSAYDSNPNNINPKYDGVRNQIYEGARVFARLRAKGGASASSDITTQLRAANRAGWATDARWWQGVGRIYRQLAGG